MTPNVVVLSTADFHSAVWTNKQFVAVGLAEETRVQYIESMGLRTPTLSRADIARMVSRVNPVHRRAPGQCAMHPASLKVVSPPVIPFHGWSAVRKINEKLARRVLVPKLEISSGDVLWTFSPITYGLERHFSTVIYHSVDLLHTLPGVPSDALLRAERSLVSRADAVIASSSGVADHLKNLRSDVLLWENVADVALFGSNATENRIPRVLFAGNITPTKVDFGLLQQIAERGMKLTLAGPVSIDGVEGEGELTDLLSSPNIEYVGNLPIEKLARLCGESMVGVIPYLVNDYTRGVFPLKVYEYMAAGMDVVSTPIPSLCATSPQGVRISPPETFVNIVEEALTKWSEDGAAARRSIAESHSWPNRIRQAWDLIGKIS